MTIPLASADVPAWVAVAIAGITVLGSWLTAASTARATVRSAIEQGRLADITALRERDASWQSHKRDVYGDLIAAGLALRADPDDDTLEHEFVTLGYRALLLMYDHHRDAVEQCLRHPKRVRDDGKWHALVCAMKDDADTVLLRMQQEEGRPLLIDVLRGNGHRWHAVYRHRKDRPQRQADGPGARPNKAPDEDESGS